MIYFVNPEFHSNIGDMAIFYSTCKLLADNSLQFSILNYNNWYNYTIHPSDIILMLGGGWMGLYDCELVDFYIFIMHKYSLNKIILLPSSFPTVVNNIKHKAISKNKLTIFARDSISYNNYKSEFPNSIIYNADDMVLYLKRRDYHMTRSNVGLYNRNDSESTGDFPKINGICKSRFTVEPYYYNISNIANIASLLNDFLKTIASFNYVITDSLHVSIFSYLTHTPCFYMNNITGKVSAFWSKYNQSLIKPYNKFKFTNDVTSNLHESDDIQPNYNRILKELS